MKKLIALTMVFILITILVGCSNSNNSDTEEYIAPTAAVQKTTVSQTEQPTEMETEEETIAETEPQTTSIEWTEFSYDTKDTDGYTYKITVKLSPWILYSETDILNSAWSVVGKDNLLPTFESWNLHKDSKNKYWRDYTGRSSDFDKGSWYYSMNDMYYCVGNVSIQNTTEGWNITKNATRTVKAQLELKPHKTYYHKQVDPENIPGLAMAFFTSSSSTWWHGIDINAKMESNNWGPVPIVFMTPENFSPNAPEGEFLEILRTGYFEPYRISDAEKIRVDIIGKNGEKFSPIKEKE